MNAFNQSLGDNYHLIDRHNETYYHLRERHFGGMGFSSEQMAEYNNPFVVGNNFANPIYLDNGNEYYIMTESGKTFENLSGLVGDVDENSKSPTKADDFAEPLLLYSRNQVIDLIDNILEHAENVLDAINNENTDWHGETLLELVESK